MPSFAVSAAQHRHANPSNFSPIGTTRPASSPSHPSPSALRFERLRGWWNSLLNHRAPVKYFDKTVVEPNVTQLPCPDNAATVRINATSPSAANLKPIHASMFEIARGNSGATAQAQPCTTYSIGQSPPEETCKDFLVAGLESGLGIYQFVSERTNRGKQSRSNTAVIQLLQKMREQSEDQPLILGNRFEVVGFEREQQQSSSRHCLRYHLTVKDTHNDNRELTVPITQAGLPFQNAVLHAEAIADASTLMNEHLVLLTKRSDGSQSEPLTLSHAGYGRNATLMTYRDLCLRIEDGSITTNEEIELQLQQFIQAQREIRPGFVHSLQQVEQLVVALEKNLEEHQRQPQQQVAVPEIRPRRAQSSARVVPLKTVTYSKAVAPQIDTVQGDIKTMPVKGMDVDRNHKHDFKDGLDAARTTDPESRKKRLISDSSLSPPPSKKLQLNHPGHPHHVLNTSSRAKQQHDTRPDLPEVVVKKLDNRLAIAARHHHESIRFPATLLRPTQPTKAGIPFEQMAALALAAVDRHAENSGQPIRVTFECANDHDRSILKDVIANKDKFKDHQNYQALLRLPYKPTDILDTACDDFRDSKKLASFAPVSIETSPAGKLVFNPATGLPTSIPRSAIPLEPWTDVPTTRKQWKAGDKQLPNEPPPRDDIRAAGVVILEDDGRVWVVAPTGGFAGMTNTFPKGRRDWDWDKSTRESWSLQSTARKEAYEESGLQVELTGFIADYKGHHTTTRYYLAKRIGGTPADVGWESQAVHLVPQDKVRSMMTMPNNEREKFILDKLDELRKAGAARS